MTFDLKKFLTENKLTKSSQLLKEDATSEIAEYIEINPQYVEAPDVALEVVIEVLKEHGQGDEIPEGMFSDLMITLAYRILRNRVTPPTFKAQSLIRLVKDPTYYSTHPNRRTGGNPLGNLFENAKKDQEAKRPSPLTDPKVKKAKDKFGDDTVLLKDTEIKNRVDNILKNPQDLNPLKADLKNLISNSSIKSKESMLKTLDTLTTPMKLMTWFYNSVLAKGGLRSPDSGSLRENQLPVEQTPDYSKYLALESAEEVIKEIDSELSKTTLESKIAKIKEIIEALENKANSLEEDSNLKGFVNTGRIKEMRRMTKRLRMTEEKCLKEYEAKYSEKKKNKKA